MAIITILIYTVIKKLKFKFPGDEKIRSAILSAAGVLLPTEKSPDEILGEFFHDAQRQQVYKDGKVFTDLVPKNRLTQIRRQYDKQKSRPGFNMRAFIRENFHVIPQKRKGDATQIVVSGASAREHITKLWPQLKQRHLRSRGTLVGLPYSYIVAGGRFSEQYYWDSYFTMLGLAQDDEWEMVEHIVKNCAYMIRKFGRIPNANRTYQLSRSQPPFFVHMVRLLAEHKGHRSTLLEYLPYLLAEYRFWIRARRSVSEDDDVRAYGRIVEMPDGVLLGRYYDDKAVPRADMYNEDMTTAEESGRLNAEELYVDLRATTESGWDFSSRWFKDPMEITTIHTTDIVPVDLNCLLYQLEMTISETYQLMLQPLLARKFRRYADRRAEAISKYMWNKNEQFFMDYDFHTKKSTHSLNLAGVFPLYAKIATKKQAAAVAKRLEKDFLKKGGLVTTMVESGQQWDSPNGWAPLQLVAIQGLRNYGFDELANKIKKAWVRTCLETYKREGKMVEKYDVVHPGKIGGGGEYASQDGFGWTNGVLAVLLDEDKKPEKPEKEAKS